MFHWSWSVRPHRGGVSLSHCLPSERRSRIVTERVAQDSASTKLLLSGNRERWKVVEGESAARLCAVAMICLPLDLLGETNGKFPTHYSLAKIEYADRMKLGLAQKA